jgi:hypothetical protein
MSSDDALTPVSVEANWEAVMRHLCYSQPTEVEKKDRIPFSTQKYPPFSYPQSWRKKPRGNPLHPAQKH